MKLTEERIRRFRGGQMLTHNKKDRCLYRGEIREITVVDRELRVKFAWRAKDESFPFPPPKWVRSEADDQSLDLNLYTVTNIGSSEGWLDRHSRFYLYSSVRKEAIVLFTYREKNNLKPTEVEGLPLTETTT